jgi:16S rRNA (guanine(966)-N(2))-methyltransferase RsmD
LDLFAGSGALGFEALSRGAESVVFVEDSRQVLKLLERNAEELGVADRVQVIGDTVARAGKRLSGEPPFDLVLADPPYAEGWELKLLADLPWQDLLTPGGTFCLEWGALKSKFEALPEKVGLLVKVREKNYGDSVLTTYSYADSAGIAPDPAPEPAPEEQED